MKKWNKSNGLRKSSITLSSSILGDQTNPKSKRPLLFSEFFEEIFFEYIWSLNYSPAKAAYLHINTSTIRTFTLMFQWSVLSIFLFFQEIASKHDASQKWSRTSQAPIFSLYCSLPSQHKNIRTLSCWTLPLDMETK